MMEKILSTKNRQSANQCKDGVAESRQSMTGGSLGAKRKEAEGKKETAAGNTRNLQQMLQDIKTFTKKFQKDIEAKVSNYKSYTGEFNNPKTNQHSRIMKQIKKQD